MRYCECGNKIPQSIRLDGKIRGLRNRSKCITCLPIGASPYSRRNVPIEEKRAKNREKQKRYADRFLLAKGDHAGNIRRINKRSFIIEKLGNKCLRCGYGTTVRNLVFHHLKDKSFSLTEREFVKSWTLLIPEIKKCLLLCHNCHGEIHDGLFSGEKEIECMVSLLSQFTDESISAEWETRTKLLS